MTTLPSGGVCHNYIPPEGEKMKTVYLEVIRGSEGYSLSISNKNTGFRLSGPKPWGGGTVVHKFEVDCSELIAQVAIHAMVKYGKNDFCHEDIMPQGEKE